MAQALIQIVIPFAAMFAIMYFLLILPEKKRSKKYNNMLAELQVNDEVLTRGGIVGKIITIDEDQLVIQSGGAYSADNKSTLAIFEPIGNGDYKFSTSTNRNSDEIIVGGVAINGEWYDLIWFNGAKTEYAEITYTINGQVQDTLRYNTDDMDIISIKNPEKEYSIHVAYYDNDGNKYE